MASNSHSTMIDQGVSVVESLLGESFRPVEPRAAFIGNLRQNLEGMRSETQHRVKKTKRYLATAAGILAAVGLIILWVQLMRVFISRTRLLFESSEKH